MKKRKIMQIQMKNKKKSTKKIKQKIMYVRK